MRQTLLVIIGLVAMTSLVFGEIPQVISYQGKVTDSVGTPVADGAYTMRFLIYTAATGGSLLWDSGDRSVTVAGGIFSVLLGESPQPPLNLTFQSDLWLLVTFAGVDQTPRQRLASVGYAYMASGLVAGTEARGPVEGYPYSAFSGINEADVGPTYGLQGISFSSEGKGVAGTSSGVSGSTYGVWGSSASTSGTGVGGYATATTGTTYGVYGESASTEGAGVYGEGRYGGKFFSASSAADAVYGRATATSGFAYGGNFVTSSTSGVAVYAEATAVSGSTYGIRAYCVSTSGIGLSGNAQANSGTTYGVVGTSVSPDGRGMYGFASNTTGSGQGVRGESASSTNGVGVYGLGSSTTGLNYGVFGRSHSTEGYGVYYAGGLAGSGTKSCVVRTSQGPTLMYCQESPENWFEDFGEGQLVDGRCHIELDPLFLETVTIDDANPMKVFVELGGRCSGVFVERGLTGFDVIEQDDGTNTVPFCYRVVAKRSGFETTRLDYCAAAERDGYLFPELREEEIRECEESRTRIEEAERIRSEKHSESAVASRQ